MVSIEKIQRATAAHLTRPAPRRANPSPNHRHRLNRFAITEWAIYICLFAGHELDDICRHFGYPSYYIINVGDRFASEDLALDPNQTNAHAILEAAK